MSNQMHKISIDLSKPISSLVGTDYHCYVDETASDQSGLIGAGMLITTSEVSETLPNTALMKLKKDPDRQKTDREKADNRTLKRGYFHASFDSANGHSYLCEGIRENIEGIFICALFDHQEARENQRLSGLNDTDIQNVAWSLATSEAQFGHSNVNILVEERDGLGAIGENWVEAYRRSLDWQQYAQPNIPTQIIYPPMICLAKPKKLAGLQTTDFLLWAAHREINGDSTWSKRAGLNLWTKTPHVGQDKGGLFVFSIGKANYIFPFPNYQTEVLKILSEEIPEGVCAQSSKYLMIEWLICICAKHLPSSIAHFEREISKCISMLGDPNKNSSSQLVERMARLFLRVFDTLPIYSQEFGLPNSDLKVLFEARNTAALVLRPDQSASRRLIPHISRFRKYLLENDPKKLPFINLFCEGTAE